MALTIYPVIMCGGAGSRLWPKSRKSQPKQFLSLVEDASMLEATLARLGDAPLGVSVAAPTVICGAGQDVMASAQLAKISGEGSVIIEPFGRNTAAVAAVASLNAAASDADAVVLLLPADHFVQDPAGFWAGVTSGLDAASDGHLVTLGIDPTGPETGYGYIQRAEALGDGVFRVENFKEKPNTETATAYLATGDYFWNAGIFLFRADAMMAAFSAYAPDILSTSKAALDAAKATGNQRMLDAAAFKACPSEPVDIAIMEKADRVAVVAPVRAGWSDVGSWAVISDLKAEASSDPSGSTSGDVISLGCEGSLIETDGPTIAAIGLKDMIVIADGGSILIVPKSQAQDVKKIVEHLKAEGRTDKL
jgi:mannose-1-phosphate guanylyltransferase/mannose-6-phosphate isomerase